MQESVLVSFAILNTNWEARHTSYIDNFVPFVSDCLRTSRSPAVSGVEVQSCLRDRFGLQIPLHGVDAILERTKRVGLVQKRDGVYVTNEEAVSGTNLEVERSSVVRQYEALLDSFSAYSQQEFEEKLSRDDADRVLLSYLQRRSLPVLQQMFRGGQSNQDDHQNRDDFLVASFITRVCEADPTMFSFLETVVKGSMLATAMYLPTPGSLGGRIEDLRVLLDTPFLLRALDYQGESQAAAATELLDVLRQLGARLVCLPGTLREMRGILDACSHQLKAPRSRTDASMPLVDYCFRHGLTSAEVDVLRERIEQDLGALGIVVQEPPLITPALAVDEDALEATLQDHVHYRRKEARLHDLNALTAVFRIRSGQPQERLETARAVFVTTNPYLVRASRTFFDEKPAGDSVNIAVLDHELGTVIWLKSPTRAPKLPAKLVLADAYAALNPPDDVWHMYLDAIDRLAGSDAITDDDYLILRYTVEARRALMNRTRGEVRAFTGGTVPEVLEVARREISARERKELEALKTELAAERLATQELRAEKAASDALLHEAAVAHSRKLSMRATSVADLVSRIAFVLLALACGAAIIIPWVAGSLGRLPLLIAAPLLVLAACGIVVGLLSALTGRSAKSLSGRLRLRTANWLERRFAAWFGLDEGPR